MKLPITSGKDNPILRAPSKPVLKMTKKILKLLRDMEETMFAENGVGIAAPQVGVNLTMALMLIDQKRVTAIINPKIVAHSSEKEEGEEGCLSLRGQWGKVERFTEVVIEFLTPLMEKRTLKLSGFNARIAQHETDHLNGILFIDRRK